MKRRKIIIGIFVFFSVYFLFLVFCKNKSGESFLLKDDFKQHEVVIDGKRISFLLPTNYSDTFLPNSLIISHWSGLNATKHVFYSTENDQNFFSVLLFDNEGEYETESQVDTYAMYQFFYREIFNEPPIVPFFEKRKEKNGYISYLSMGSCVFSFDTEENIELEEQRLIYSKFDYVIFPKYSDYKPYSKFYLCALRTNDKIKDFSYAEKRKIIESVKIEEIK